MFHSKKSKIRHYFYPGKGMILFLKNLFESGHCIGGFWVKLGI